MVKKIDKIMTRGSTQLVTKEHFDFVIAKLNERMDRFDERMDRFEERMDRFETGFVTKVEFYERIQQLEDRMYTKEDHAKFMMWMDEAMTELRDARDERKYGERQRLRMDDKLANHEKRICILEQRPLNR